MTRVAEGSSVGKWVESGVLAGRESVRVVPKKGRERAEEERGGDG